MNGGKFALCALLMLGLGLWWGCDKDDEKTIEQPPEPTVTLVFSELEAEISMQDSAVLPGWVQVRDTDGRGVPGRVVAFTLTAPCGLIEPADPARRDTTDGNGRVPFSFRVSGTDGPCRNTLAVRVGSRTDSARLVVDVVDWRVGTVTLIAEQDTLWPDGMVPPGGVTAAFHGSVRDSTGNPAPRVPVHINVVTVDSGFFTVTADDQGDFSFNTPLTGYGTHRVIAACGLQRDTARVVVEPHFMGVAQLILSTDTVVAFVPDTFTVDGTVIAQTHEGALLPGVPVSLSLSEPCGWIEFLNPELLDTTDQSGRVPFRIRGTGEQGPCQMWVRAEGGRVIEDQTLLVIEVLGEPARVELRPDTQIVRILDSTRVTARVWDAAGHPRSGVPVAVTATFGEIHAVTDTTNSQGILEFHWVAGTTAGQVQIVAQAGAAADSVTLEVMTRPASRLQMNISGDTLATDLASQNAIVISVVSFDSNGNPIEGIPVHLEFESPGAEVYCDSKVTPIHCRWVPHTYGRLMLRISGDITLDDFWIMVYPK